MMCNKCMGITGTLVLLAGIGFLLRDFGVWNFWNIQGWTAVFVIFGLAKLSSLMCDECQALMKKK